MTWEVICFCSVSYWLAGCFVMGWYVGSDECTYERDVIVTRDRFLVALMILVGWIFYMFYRLGHSKFFH